MGFVCPQTGQGKGGATVVDLRKDGTPRGVSMRVYVSPELLAAIKNLAAAYRVDDKALIRQMLAEAVINRENQLGVGNAMAAAAIERLIAADREHGIAT